MDASENRVRGVVGMYLDLYDNGTFDRGRVEDELVRFTKEMSLSKEEKCTGTCDSIIAEPRQRR